MAYGGHVGDCGDYHGRVVAIDAKDPTKVAGWATGGRGEAIWAAGGMASDGDGVIATTGNRTADAPAETCGRLLLSPPNVDIIAGHANLSSLLNADCRHNVLGRVQLVRTDQHFDG